MKNRGMFRATAVMAFLILCVCASGAFAENRAGAINVTPWIGGYNVDGDLPYENGWTYGLSLGYNFTEKWGAEFSFNYVESDYDGPIHINGGIDWNKDDANIYLYRLDMLYHITGILPDMVTPYLAGGVGMSTFDPDRGDVDSDNDFILNYGAGLKFFLSRNMALRADVRQVVDFEGSDTYNNLLYTAGLCFEFGGKGKEAELAAPMDSDGDGVTDDIDRCPNTPAGCKVDAYGCPLDSDGDGVIDCMDKCPNTPAGCKVDKDGCPIDSDGDGVIDCMDKCPNTPAGVKVDANGCPPAVEQGAIIFRNIQFDLGKATLREESYPILDEVTDYMKANAGVKMEVQGHTCNLGTAAFNLRLSDQRANTVRDYLVENGVPGDRLTAKGYGLTQPIAPNDVEENRAKNRRVEFKPIQ